MACSRIPKCRFRPPDCPPPDRPRPRIQAVLGRRREIGRTADQPRIMCRNSVQDLGRGIAAGESFSVSGECRQVGIPTIGQRLRLHPLESVGKIGVLLR